ncbi:glycosyltransferase family 32 protein [Faecalibaculum rodentium]|uniref:glycosyltransferase family 32 protein n=1 Tax=Faecalibaculum rodentium TaxID=1702221 RepID=UPI0023F32A96|nr:glycosyltransferase [Faecalibaculum rodentium]
MIPKIIHYCWLGGGELPVSVQLCIDSWKKYCPDYEIKQWDESNFDFLSHPFMQEAIKNKAWGFVPDVARLQIVYLYGGIYLDTDVEICRSLDDLLENKTFFGRETADRVNLGSGFGAEPKQPIIKDLLSDYEGLHFINSDGSFNRIPSPRIQTNRLKQKGLIAEDINQDLGDCVVYKTDYFCPLSPDTGILNVTKDTYSIHHFDGSWLSEKEIRMSNHKKRIYKRFGSLGQFIWDLIKIKDMVACYGWKETRKRFLKRVRGS